MSKSSITIQLNLKPVARELEQRKERAKRNLLKRMLEDTTPFVPMKTGNLRDSGRVIEDGLEWTADYAGHVYYGLQKHEIGTREWFEAAKNVYMKSWLKQFEKDMNGR